MFSFDDGLHTSPFHWERGTSLGFPLSPPPFQLSLTFTHRESSSHTGTSALSRAPFQGHWLQKGLLEWSPSTQTPLASDGLESSATNLGTLPTPILNPFIHKFQKVLFLENLIIRDILAWNTLPMYRHSIHR